MQQPNQRIGLVDDHPLFRHGLTAVLHRVAGLEVVWEVASASEALALVRQEPIDLVIVDILMPTMSGISLTAELREAQPRCKILGLSSIEDIGIIGDMFRVDASGYALKSQPAADIVEAIHVVLAGARYLSPVISRAAIDAELATKSARPLTRLTKREREVFELLIRGNSNDEIAARLFISTRTVETHRAQVVKKLSTHSIVQMQRHAALFGGLGP